MAQAGKIFLVKIAGMAVSKNRAVKNSSGIEEGSISGDCKDDLVNKEGRNMEVKID